MTFFKTWFKPAPAPPATQKPAYKPPPPPPPPPAPPKATASQSSFQPAPAARPKVDLSGGAPFLGTPLRTGWVGSGSPMRVKDTAPVLTAGEAGRLTPEEQLTQARTQLETAVEELKQLSVDDPRFEAAWEQVQRLAGVYAETIQRVYGVTIDQTLPEGADHEMAWLDLNGWSRNSAHGSIRQDMATNTLNLLLNFDTGLQQTADYLAEATGIDDPYAAFQEVMGPVNFHLVGSLPSAAGGAKGYTEGQNISFRIGPDMPLPMASDLVIHELGHVLMFRAGNGNGERSPLQQALGDGTSLAVAESSMDQAIKQGGEEVERHHDEASPRETGADLFLFYVRGWLSKTPLNGTMEETISAAAAHDE